MSKTAKEIRKHARAWMILNDIKIMDIQKALGLNTHVQISFTLSGVKNHRRVLAYLLKKGCPSEYLDLPGDMSEQA